jgi:hypothetical protein
VKRLLALLVVVGLAAGLIGCTSSPTTGGVKPPTSTKPPPPLPTDGKGIKPSSEPHKMPETKPETKPEKPATTKDSKKD